MEQYRITTSPHTLVLQNIQPAGLTIAPGIHIAQDGKVTIPEGLTLDDAALAFWHAVERHFTENIKREDRK